MSRCCRVILLLAAAVAACADRGAAGWSGYVEGDYVYVAAPLGGNLEALAVRRGQAVARGAPLFALDADLEQAARGEAQAKLAAARAQALDTQKGRRPDEVAVTEAQLAQARAEAKRTQDEYVRAQGLVAQGFISTSRLEETRTAADQARDRVTEMTASLRVARLPAREDERTAAQATAQAAQEALRQTDWRTQQKAQRAPCDAVVADTFFRVGEWVQGGQPVVALLPPATTRARFFVPEAELASIAIGQPVEILCDGCGAPIPARIDFIATQAEYTPPVIYSNAQRARLVFMVEARPTDAKDTARIKPGQPVDVRRAGGARP